jgi:hypothetical protein
VKVALLVALLVLVSCAQLPKRRTDKLSILQGVTNTKEVEFSVVARKGANLGFELRAEDGERIAPDETKVLERGFSPYAVHKAVFVRDPQKIYNLYVTEAGKVVDQRLVGRGPRESAKLRLAVLSCLNDFHVKEFKIWDVLQREAPEYVLMIGDNVYADMSSLTTGQVTDPEVLWNRYVDARLTLPFFFQERLLPTHALWDDHDYGQNNSDGTFAHKEAAKEVFDAFFAQDLSDDDWTKGYGTGGLLSLGDFNLYFLDARSFRAPEKTGSHLGLDQTAWFYSKLRAEPAPSFIIKGDQFFGGYHPFESYEGNHPHDFQEFVGQLRQIKTPFIFLSGDRHLSEIMQFPRSLFGKPSFEITSSPMHAKTFGAAEDKNPWRVVGEKTRSNFVIIDSLARDNHWFLDVTSYGEGGDVYFRRELAVYIQDLQDNLKENRKRRSGERRYRKVRKKRRSSRR